MQVTAGMLKIGAALTLAVAILAAGCARPQEPTDTGPMMRPGPAAQKQTIKQIGSTTVLPLAEVWREKFNAQHPEINIAVSGGGSGTGIESLLNGSADIANSSRDIKDEEIQQAESRGITVVEHTVAYDGIAIVANPANPLSRIDVEALSDIYTGKLTKWDQAGAPGLGEIAVISRDSASGTYESFKEMVIQLHGSEKDRDYAASALKQQSNEAILQMVARTKGAIGYIGLGYVDESVKVLAVIHEDGTEAVMPTIQTVQDGSYPIARALHMYTNGEPSGAIKQYLDFVKGPEGQSIVEELGFVPISN